MQFRLFSRMQARWCCSRHAKARQRQSAHPAALQKASPTVIRRQMSRMKPINHHIWAIKGTQGLPGRIGSSPWAAEAQDGQRARRQGQSHSSPSLRAISRRGWSWASWSSTGGTPGWWHQQGRGSLSPRAGDTSTWTDTTARPALARADLPAPPGSGLPLPPLLLGKRGQTAALGFAH